MSFLLGSLCLPAKSGSIDVEFICVSKWESVPPKRSLAFNLVDPQKRGFGEPSMDQFNITPKQGMRQTVTFRPFLAKNPYSKG